MDYLLQNLIDAISLGSLYALLALGMALLFGIMNLVNLAHGELLMVGGYAMIVLANQSAIILVVGVVVIVIVTALLMERVAFRPVRQASPTTLMVTSFAVSYMVQNIALLAFGARPKGVPVGASLIEPVTVMNLRIVRLNLVIIVLTVVLLVVLILFLKRTSLGIQMRAAAEDFTMARVLGVRANTVIASAFAISGFLAAVVAFFLIIQVGLVRPNIGLEPLVIAMVATVIGGLGRLEGAALGGFIVGFLSILMQAFLPTEFIGYRQAFLYIIVIGFILLKPQGLLPSRTVGRSV